VGGFGVVDDAIQLARGTWDRSDELALWGCYCKLSRTKFHLVALSVECAE